MPGRCHGAAQRCQDGCWRRPAHRPARDRARAWSPAAAGFRRLSRRHRAAPAPVPAHRPHGSAAQPKPGVEGEARVILQPPLRQRPCRILQQRSSKAASTAGAFGAFRQAGAGQPIQFHGRPGRGAARGAVAGLPAVLALRQARGRAPMKAGGLGGQAACQFRDRQGRRAAACAVAGVAGPRSRSPPAPSQAAKPKQQGPGRPAARIHGPRQIRPPGQGGRRRGHHQRRALLQGRMPGP